MRVSPWTITIAVYGASVVAAMQVGRIAPAAVSLRQEFVLSLTQLGWSVSLVTMVSAVVGLGAGFWVVAKGARRVLLFGLLALAASAAVSALAVSSEMLLAIRVMEGFGYLAIVVAAPTLVARHTKGRDLARALALWATFFTVGLSLSSMAGGWVSTSFGWRIWFGGNVVALLIVLAIVRAVLPHDGAGSEQHAGAVARVSQRSLLPAWLLGIGFMGVTLISLAVVSLLPTYLVDQYSYEPAAAGNVTALVALASLGGGLLFGLIGNYRGRVRIVAVACLAMIAGAWPAFGLIGSAGSSIAGAALIVGANGVLVAMVFAAVPRLSATAAAVGPANGLVAQLGSVGALSGPPLVGYAVSLQGWGALVPLIVVFSLLSLGLIAAAEHVRARVVLTMPAG